jgi:hypothetical protein
MREMEASAREIAAVLGRAVKIHEQKYGTKTGFALFLFSFYEHGEMTYVSNAQRADMVKMLMEFVAKNPPELTWDEQHG